MDKGFEWHCSQQPRISSDIIENINTSIYWNLMIDSSTHLSITLYNIVSSRIIPENPTQQVVRVNLSACLVTHRPYSATNTLTLQTCPSLLRTSTPAAASEHITSSAVGIPSPPHPLGVAQNAASRIGGPKRMLLTSVSSAMKKQRQLPW